MTDRIFYINSNLSSVPCEGCYSGDAPLASPAKAEEEKPAPRQAPKRQRVQEESDQDLGCPSAKIPRLKVKHGGKWVAPQKHAA
ncbi:DPEP2 neighbor protein [Psammomys obesus]|uniref:DPEP2 neighbor protein n=1 Tax=Psammomys obesus TaxID=48139 RepID=UPI0024530194|nr:DPEP2 neighbor protein [Psammomys obesus]